MKNALKLILLTLCVICGIGLTGCNNPLSSKINEANKHIEQIIVYTAEKNPENIFEISWPNKGYYTQYDTCHNFVNRGELTKADEKFIKKFVNNLPYTNSYSEYDDYLAEITIIYDSGVKIESRTIYKDYPEDFDKFADIINRLCGGDKTYLRYDKNIQEVTPEYFTSRTRLSDANIYGGTVQEMIDLFDVNMYLMNNETNYFFETKAERFSLVKMLPFNIEQVPSSDEEAYAYACEVASLMDADASVVKKHKAPYENVEFYSWMDEKLGEIRVYRTDNTDIVMKGGTIGSFDELQLYEDLSGGYDELMNYQIYEYVYSNDNKFAVAAPYSYEDDFYDRFEELGHAVKDM